MRIAWFDCFSGISGDMTLGALVSAGWPAEEAQSLPRRLGLEGVRVVVRDVRRGPLAAVQVEVVVEASQQPHRHLRHVEEALARADLPAAVRERARAAFRRLAAGGGRSARHERRTGALPRGGSRRRPGGRGRRDAGAREPGGHARPGLAAPARARERALRARPDPGPGSRDRAAPAGRCRWRSARWRASSRRPRAPRCSPRWSRTGGRPPRSGSSAWARARGRASWPGSPTCCACSSARRRSPPARGRCGTAGWPCSRPRSTTRTPSTWGRCCRACSRRARWTRWWSRA